MFPQSWWPVTCECADIKWYFGLSLSIPAMASYLYIVKYELPIVINAFLDTKER